MIPLTPLPSINKIHFVIVNRATGMARIEGKALVDYTLFKSLNVLLGPYSNTRSGIPFDVSGEIVAFAGCTSSSEWMTWIV